MSVRPVSAVGSDNAGGGVTITMKVPSSAPTGGLIRNSVGVAQPTNDIATNGTYWVAAAGGNFTGYLSYTTDPTGTWTSASLSPTPNVFRRVAYGNGYWVAVGDSGEVWYATDPSGTWTQNKQGTTTFNAVAYGNGYWVAAGLNGTSYYRATDPTGAWTSKSIGGTTLYGVAYGNGYWVAAGGSTSGVAWYATDPSGTWTQNSPGGTSAMEGCTYGNGYWVLVGDTGALYYRATDPTGTWTSNTQGSVTHDCVIWTGTYWVMGGTAADFWYNTVPSGAWTNNTRTASGNYNGLAYGNGYLVAANQLDPASVDVSADVRDGDVLLMAVAVRGGSNTTITDPAGWTLLGSQVNSGTTLAQKLYARVASSEPASYSVTITSNKASGVMVAVRGAEQAAPASAQYAGQANSSSTTVTYPGLGSWGSTDGVDLVFGGYAHAPTPAPPTNYAETYWDASTSGGSNSRTTSENAWEGLSAVTTVGQLTASWTGTAAVNIGHHVFVKMAAVTRPSSTIRRLSSAVMRSTY